jgi:iron complex transport system permease protein
MSELAYAKHKDRSAKAFRTRKEAGRYWIMLIAFLLIGIAATFGLLVYKNPVPVTSPSFIPVVKRRMAAIITMIIAAVCQSLSTVAFQSTTNNRMITPSLLGFEALYSAIQTGIMYFFGARAFISLSNRQAFIIQIIAMVGLCLILYGWLLSGKYGNLQLMLLVGVIMGTGLRSLSSFMRRLLAPSEFDILQAKLFGSVNNADTSYFVIAIPVVLIAAVLIIAHSRKLNLMSLGKDVCTSLGANHRFSTVYILILVAVLMAISTALVGSLTFFGFLVATLSYQFAPTYDHRYIFPMALALGFLVLTASYFFMNHVFNAQGVVSIIIEMFGGITFLIVILRKGIL